MKKYLIMAVGLAVAGSMSAQKAVVDQAKKLAGKPDQVEMARSLIKEAAANPETANDVYTYFIGGKVEFDNFDKNMSKLMINPKDESVKELDQANFLLNGYKMFQKALPLDAVPDAKGKSGKYAKEINNKLNSHFNDMFGAGGTFYNNKQFYPEAYEAFMAYGDIAKSPTATKNIQSLPDSVINTAYFNAGISAYAGSALPQAAEAFKKARLNNSDNSQNYIYEIACWQYMAQNDSTLQDAAKRAIEEVARAGYEKFGMDQPLFINNLVNSYVLEERIPDAIALINEQLAKTPDTPALYGLRGYVYDRQGNDEASLADYKKAVAFDNADFETLKNASKKIFKTGTEALNKIEAGENARALKQKVKAEYFDPAKAIADRAKALNPGDSDIDYILENINYALETYFPGM